MRPIKALCALALAGCAAEGGALDDPAPAHSAPPEPPPGATTESRYAFDCATLDYPPVDAIQNVKATTAEPSGSALGAVDGYTLDPENLPLGMVVYSRLSDEMIEWADRNGLDIPQGVDKWSSEIAFDKQGRAIVECDALAACVEYPCDGWTEDMTPNWGAFVGWMQEPIELVVWE